MPVENVCAVYYFARARGRVARGEAKVRCPECAAEVSALREFCPHCGTSLHRDARDVRGPSTERSEEELKRNRKTVLIAGAALLLALGVMGKGSWFMTRIDLGGDESRRAPAVVQAEQFFQAYRQDPHKADKLYRHREMVVTGEFLRIAPDGSGDPDLRLKTSDPEAPLGVDLIRASQGQATELKPGQIITVSCERVGRTGEERWLRNCAIQTVRDTAAPAAAPAPAAPAKDAKTGG